MKGVTSFLQMQDYFGVSPTFTLHGKMKFQNIGGGFISLVINVLCIALTFNYCFEIFSHNNPYLQSVNVSSSKQPNLTLSSDNLIISFGIMGRNYEIIDDASLFTVDTNYLIITSQNNSLLYQKFPLKRINCTNINLKKYKEANFETEFYSNNLQDYYCYNETEENNPIILGGLYGSEFYGTITVSILKCNNDTSAVPCKSQEEIDAALNYCYFEVFFLDHHIDPLNYYNPIRTSSQSFYYQIDPKLSKFIYSQFSSIRLISDNGFIYPKKREMQSFKYNSVSVDIFSLQPREPIMKLWVMSSVVEEVYNRSYLKFSSICGNVGGLLKGLQIMGFICYSFIELKLYQKCLINSLFEFRNKERKPLDILYSLKKARHIYDIKRENKDGKNEILDKKIIFNIPLIDSILLDIFYCGGKKRKKLSHEYQLLLKTLINNISFDRIVLNQNECFIIKEHLFEKNVKSPLKFVWNIYNKYPPNNVNYNNNSNLNPLAQINDSIFNKGNSTKNTQIAGQSSDNPQSNNYIQNSNNFFRTKCDNI